jgi:hypothetical protein
LSSIIQGVRRNWELSNHAPATSHQPLSSTSHQPPFSPSPILIPDLKSSKIAIVTKETRL